MILFKDHGLSCVRAQGTNRPELAAPPMVRGCPSPMGLLGSPLVVSATGTVPGNPEYGNLQARTGKGKDMLKFNATDLNDLSLRSYLRQYKQEPNRRLPPL
ncbi:hypothetical protein ACSYDW_12595 [Paeniglutamicibacter sp. R2-26]|uniref:hypothetical protein n=1 Tax=Paeniglutamicibacter sp. R2-26 TaxID=3144417 RepID=UPI003EE63D97